MSTKMTPAERQARMDAEDAEFVAEHAPAFAGEPEPTETPLPAEVQPRTSALFDLDPFEDKRPGAPYFDETMNYLQTQYAKTTAEVGKLSTRAFKIEEEIGTKERELETVKELILHEWRDRQPTNPETGEIIPEPFAPVFFGDLPGDVALEEPDPDAEEDDDDEWEDDDE